MAVTARPEKATEDDHLRDRIYAAVRALRLSSTPVKVSVVIEAVSGDRFDRDRVAELIRIACRENLSFPTWMTD